MKKILLFFFISVCLNANAQTGDTCDDAYSLCNLLGTPFTNNVRTPSLGTLGCLYTTPNPTWLQVNIAEAGELHLQLKQVDAGNNPIDIDFALWGPFFDTEHCGGSYINEANLVSCSYSASPFEYIDVPNAQAGATYILLVTNFMNSSGFIQMEALQSSTATIGCAQTKIVAYLDVNQNGTKDNGESALPYGHFTVQELGGTTQSIFDSDGIITLYNQNTQATYNVSYDLPEPYSNYFQINPATYESIGLQAPSQAETHYFAVEPVSGFSDISVSILTQTSPRPGFTNTVRINCQNLGLNPDSGTITVNIPQDQTLTSVPTEAINVTATSFEIPYINLEPCHTASYIVQLSTSTSVPTGTLFTYSANVTSNSTDINSTNNTSIFKKTVVGSYDPNDVTESRGKLVPVSTFNTDADYLYYTIRFQNTGTANASFITVAQTLSDNIIPETFEMISSSHNYVVKRSGNSTIWNFDNINLPYRSANDLGSQGYIYYRVKARPGIVVGSTIDASAAIYFDYNAPVITQTYQTLFTEDTSGTTDVKANRFVLYPNPANESVNIQATENITAVSVYDISGKTLISKPVIAGQNVSLSLAGLQSGTYFIKVATEKGSSIKTLIKH